MNAPKAIAVLVTICIIGPMLLGYCWPTSSEEVEQYGILDGTEITGDVANDQVPIFTNYTGYFNHQFAVTEYTTSGGTEVADSIVPVPWVVSSTGSVPTYRNIEALLTLDEGERLDFSFGTTGLPTGTTRVDYNYAPGFDVEGKTATHLSLFPYTGQIVYIDIFSGAGTVTTDAVITAKAAGTADIDQYIQVDGAFANLDSGFHLPIGYSWANGFLNSAATFLLHPLHASWECMFGVNGMGALWLQCDDDGLVEAAFTADFSEPASSSWRLLGTMSAYPNLCIEIDAHAGVMSVSGVSGMSSTTGGFGFTDPTYSLVNTIEFETSYSSGFTVVDVVTSSPDLAYLVKSTTSQIGTRPGLVNASLEPDGFYPDRNWQLFIEDTSVFGDSLSLFGIEYDVTRTGDITVDLVEGGTMEFKIRDLTILSVGTSDDRRVFLDGVEIIAGPGDSIEFGGAWMAKLILYDMDVSEKTVYDWEAGGFGLDVTGFCMAGLMIDILAFAALTLYGRGAGARVLPLLIACAIIGAVFFILLVEGI